jgi:hypothetical protein
MPHTYMRTCWGSIGVKVSTARESVLWMRSVMGRKAGMVGVWGRYRQGRRIVPAARAAQGLN